jgi:proline iminopeptidase
MGHSWGGAVVAQYVLTKGPRGVESLILGSPLLSTPDWVRDAEVLRQQLPAATQATLRKHEAAGTTSSAEYRAAEAEFYKLFMARHPRTPEPDCAGSVFNRQIYEYMWGPSEFHATGTLIDFDLNARLGELRLPVLLIVGEFDEARPETAARYQRRIPGAQLTVVPDAGHAVWSDNLRGFVGAIEKFLQGVDSRRR